MSHQYLTVDQKILKALDEKESGNNCFKEGQLRKAKKKYHIALMYVKDVEKPNPLEKMAGIQSKPLSEIQLTCLLKSEEYEKVINYTTKVLENNAGDSKALFRRAQAYFHSKDFEKAESDFLKLIELNPNDTLSNPFLKEIETQKKACLSKEKEMYRKMMGGANT